MMVCLCCCFAILLHQLLAAVKNGDIEDSDILCFRFHQYGYLNVKL